MQPTGVQLWPCGCFTTLSLFSQARSRPGVLKQNLLQHTFSLCSSLWNTIAAEATLFAVVRWCRFHLRCGRMSKILHCLHFFGMPYLIRSRFFLSCLSFYVFNLYVNLHGTVHTFISFDQTPRELQRKACTHLSIRRACINHELRHFEILSHQNNIYKESRNIHIQYLYVVVHTL